MRRTLTVAVLTAALLGQAGAALACHEPSSPKSNTNASCSNGKGGNGGTYSGNGNTSRAADKCGADAVTPPNTTTPPPVAAPSVPDRPTKAELQASKQRLLELLKDRLKGGKPAVAPVVDPVVDPIVDKDKGGMTDG